LVIYCDDISGGGLHLKIGVLLLGAESIGLDFFISTCFALRSIISLQFMFILMAFLSIHLVVLWIYVYGDYRHP
jgi:membrane protein implicated in regulation of membrane protease activity